MYNSLISSLKAMFARPNFVHRCNDWRNNHYPTVYLVDVYSERIWKEWQERYGAFSVNSWKYLDLQFKLENLIIIGLIRGLNEPKLTVNSFISPLVDELLELWKGVQIPKQDSVLGNFTIRAAL